MWLCVYAVICIPTRSLGDRPHPFGVGTYKKNLLKHVTYPIDAGAALAIEKRAELEEGGHHVLCVPYDSVGVGG